MSRTAPALVRIDEFLTALRGQAPGPQRDQLISESEALRRATVAFHMEAIRFRMHSVERLLRANPDASLQRSFEELRLELETAGFHTRSHTAL